MLIKDFYTILKIDHSPENHIVTVELNAKHDIYKGHFPQQAVVPGVCMLQIIKESAELILNSVFRYSEISSCKFLSVINPVIDNVLEISLTLKQNEKFTSLVANANQNKQQVIKLKAVLAE